MNSGRVKKGLKRKNLASLICKSDLVDLVITSRPLYYLFLQFVQAIYVLCALMLQFDMHWSTTVHAISVSCFFCPSFLITFVFQPATSEYIVKDTGNCSPRYLRCTINQVLIEYLKYVDLLSPFPVLKHFPFLCPLAIYSALTARLILSFAEF